MNQRKTKSDKPKSAFWLRFISILEERDMTQLDVSRLTGISTQAIQKWKEVDGWSPGAASLQLLTDALRVPVEMLTSDAPDSLSLQVFLHEEKDLTLDERAFLWSQSRYLHQGDPGVDWWFEQLRSYRMRMRLLEAQKGTTRAS